LKPARPTGSGTLPSRRIAAIFGIVNHLRGVILGKPRAGFPSSRSIAAPRSEVQPLQLGGDQPLGGGEAD